MDPAFVAVQEERREATPARSDLRRHRVEPAAAVGRRGRGLCDARAAAHVRRSRDAAGPPRRSCRAARLAYLLPWNASAAAAVTRRCEGVRMSFSPAPVRTQRPQLLEGHGDRPRARQLGRRAAHAGGARQCRRCRGRRHRLGVHRVGHVARQRPGVRAGVAARAARVGRADAEPVGGLGALRARAAVRPAGHARSAWVRSGGPTSRRSTWWCCPRATTRRHSAATGCAG